MEQQNGSIICKDGKAVLTPSNIESLDEVIFGHPSDTVASLHGSTDKGCSSNESFDVYDGENESLGTSECSSSISSRSSSSSIDEEPLLRPANDKELQDQQDSGTDMNKDGELEEEEDGEEEKGDGGRDTRVRNEPSKENHSKALSRSRRKRRDGGKRKKGRPEEGSTRLDDAWSNRWLTGKEMR